MLLSQDLAFNILLYISGVPDQESSRGLLERMNSLETTISKILLLLGDTSAGEHTYLLALCSRRNSV